MTQVRSIGVTVFSCIYFALGACTFLGIPFDSIQCRDLVCLIGKIFPRIDLVFLVAMALFLVSALQLFRLNPLGIKLACFPLLVFSIPPCGSYFYLLLAIAHIYFFTRSQVKEQFRVRTHKGA
jgi:hypothetical protein